LERGERYRLEISDSEILLDVPGNKQTWNATDDLGSLWRPRPAAACSGIAPLAASGGRGPTSMAMCAYVGTAPLAGHDGLVDVLTGVYGAVETRFYFDRTAGLLLALEMFPRPDADPCELYFADYQEIGGRWMPQRIEVRYGDDRFATFKIQSVRFVNPDQP